MGRTLGRGIFILLIALLLGLTQSKSETNAGNTRQCSSQIDFSNTLTPAMDCSLEIVITSKNSQHNKVGAGVIWRDRGDECYILTCRHLFIDMENPKITVYPFGNRLPHYGREAQLVGGSDLYDVAVLKAQWPDTIRQTATISAEEKPGMAVFALGNPQGLGGSVSSGVLSLPYEEMGECFLHRTDCRLLPGNSGGGLFDREGHILGIITSKVITDTCLEGYGYAIPFCIADAVGNAILASRGNEPVVCDIPFSYQVTDRIRGEKGEWTEQIAVSHISEGEICPLSVGDRICKIETEGITHLVTSKAKLALFLLSLPPYTEVEIETLHYGEPQKIRFYTNGKKLL